MRAGELATLVVEVAQVVDGEVAGGGDQATGVVQVAGGGAEVQGNCAAQQRAVLVIQLGAVERQGIARVEQALIAVGQAASNVEYGVATAGERATAVVEVAGLRIDRGGGNQAFDVGQGLVDAQGQRGVAQQLAAAVVEVVGGKGERLVAGNLAALVVHVLEVVEHQQRRIDQAVLVVELAPVEVQGQGRGAGDLAALLVVQVGGAEGQGPARAQGAVLAVVEAGSIEDQATVGDQAPASVIHRAEGAEGQRAGAGQRTGVVGQGARRNAQQPFAADQTLVAVEQLVDIQTCSGAGNQQPAVAVIQLRSRHHHARTAGQLAVAVVDVDDIGLHTTHACDQAFLAVVEAVTGHAYRALAGDQPGLVVEAADVEAERIARGDEACDVIEGRDRERCGVQA